MAWCGVPPLRSCSVLASGAKTGYLADLLLVAGDPLADISILQDAARLVGIMKDGVLHKVPRVERGAARFAAE